MSWIIVFFCSCFLLISLALVHVTFVDKLNNSVCPWIIQFRDSFWFFLPFVSQSFILWLLQNNQDTYLGFVHHIRFTIQLFYTYQFVDWSVQFLFHSFSRSSKESVWFRKKRETNKQQFHFISIVKMSLNNFIHLQILAKLEPEQLYNCFNIIILQFSFIYRRRHHWNRN